MDEMMAKGAPPEGAAPQGPPQQGGEEVIKDAAASLMQTAQMVKQASEAFAQAGAPPEAAKMLSQAGDLIQQAMQAMGIQSGAPKGGPEAAMGGNPDVAGNPGARPADMRG